MIILYIILFLMFLCMGSYTDGWNGSFSIIFAGYFLASAIGEIF